MIEVPPRRRWFQYSLRTLLIVMAVLTLPLGWWSYKAEKQRRAVRVLEDSDARITFNDGNHRLGPHQRFLHWRYRVTDVVLHNRVTESDIAALQSLEGLESVAVYPETDLARLRAALPECSIEPVAIPKTSPFARGRSRVAP